MPSSLWLPVLLSSAAAFAQQPAVPTFRTGTKLVQVSVIAQDKKGKPVADLRRDEFTVFDDGAAQEIRLFLAETAAPEPVSTQPRSTFSNQIAGPANSASGSHSGYSVILIDNLSTDFGDPRQDGSGYAREETLRMLRSIPPGEKTAIYALQRKLQIVAEFTSDRDLLERQLMAWKPGSDTPSTSLSVMGNGTGSGDASGSVISEAARIDALQRAADSNAEMEAVAEHLAGVPGRKNLIWLANRFTISPRALQKLNDASVAIYPVDPAGIKSPFERRVQMRAVAEQTGGVAYFGRNDIDAAIHEAMDDGRVSYTLGFYQSSEDFAPRIHPISVRVNRPGIELRYRTSYQSESPAPASKNPKAAFLEALNRPVNVANLPVTATITRTQDRLSVQALLDAASLELVPQQSRWTGKIEVVARFTTADGKLAGEGLSQTITFNLRQATYDAALQRGLPYHNELKIPPKAVELKLLFGNPATGRIGTVTVPLSEVEGASANAK